MEQGNRVAVQAKRDVKDRDMVASLQKGLYNERFRNILGLYHSGPFPIP